MERRTFLGVIAGGLLAAPLAAEAQQSGKVPKVGYLSASSPSVEGYRRKSFSAGLRDLGWVEGQNILVEERWAETIPIVMALGIDPIGQGFIATPFSYTSAARADAVAQNQDRKPNTKRTSLALSP